METPKAAVFLGKEELKWLGEDKERGLLLLAAYLGGNTPAQLHSGIKRNDRYAGLLYLFQVYRTLQEKNKDYKVPSLDLTTSPKSQMTRMTGPRLTQFVSG